MTLLITALIIGAVFGIGLAIAGMLNPSKVVGFLNIFDIKPKGPLAAFTAKITSTSETTAWHIDKKECINWLNDFVSIVGTYTNLIPFT